MFPNFNIKAQKKTGINAPVDDDGRCALHLAATAGNMADIRLLLKSGANPDQPDKNGITPMMHAIAARNLDIVDAFLKAGAKPDAGRGFAPTPLRYAIENDIDAAFIAALYDRGMTQSDRVKKENPLHTACAAGRDDLLAFFAARGVPVDHRNTAGDTPLHLAAENGHTAAAREMLRLGAASSIRNDNVETPLLCALAARQNDVAALLLDIPAVCRTLNDHATYKEGHTPLLVAAQDGNDKMVEKLAALGADIHHADHEGRNSLCHAVAGGHLSTVRLLLRLGIDTRDAQTSRFAMQDWAAIDDDRAADMLRLLVENGIDIDARDKDGDTVLHNAADNAQAERIGLLLALGADANAQDSAGNRAIDRLTNSYYFTLGDASDCLHRLLRHGADPDMSPHPDVTDGPIHIMARYGHNASITLLLQHKARIDMVENGPHQRTAFLMAAAHGQRATVMLLHRHGANTGKTDANGANALHLAAESGNALTFDYLREHTNLSIAARDDIGRTPLHYACAKEKQNIVEKLIRDGAPLDAYDHHGLTPLHLAMQEGSDDVIASFADAAPADFDWNHTTRNGEKTALHFALQRGLYRQLRLLLAAGADPTVSVGAEKNTVLHAAMEHNDFTLAEILTAYMVEKDIGIHTLKNKDGMNPVHYAAMIDNGWCAHHMVLHGADATVRDGRGDTALHTAVRFASKAAARQLAESAPECLYLRNKAGETPVDIALRTQNADILAVLTSALEKEAAKKQPKPPAPPAP